MKHQPEVVETHFLDSAPDIPNNPALPVLIYRKALPAREKDKAGAFERLFLENGWRGVWRNGIFDYHHFHPDAHEALGIARGHVTVLLGGETGARLRLEAGDLAILPAGTGHKRLDSGGDLLVVGAYPKGQENYQLCKSGSPCGNAEQSIAGVPLPDTDPLLGKAGPLAQHWSGRIPGRSK